MMRLPPTEDRVAELERLLGDPRETTLPLSDAAVLAADRRGELPLGGEPTLASFGLHEEFVPADLGGRLTGLDTVARLLRAVYRRDSALGGGYGTASLLPALSVWHYGDAAQRRAAATVLLDGGRLVAAPREAPAAARAGIGLRAAVDAGGLSLSGHSAPLLNAPRADAFVVLAEHGNGNGDEHEGGPGNEGASGAEPGADGGDTAMLLPRQELPTSAVRELPSQEFAGLRRLPVGELRFDGWPVGAGRVLGTTGHGSAALVRAHQMARPLVPAMAIGCADTALRSVLSVVLAGGDNGHSFGSRYAQEVIASAFADLLIADCLSLATLRALHLLPALSSLWSAASTYLGHRLLQQSTGDLLPVLAHARHDGVGYGTFRKHLIDLSELPPGRTGAVAALSSLVPQLATLARRSWKRSPHTAPEELFGLHDALPPLDASRLKVAAADDPLTSLLADVDGLLDGGPALDSAHGRVVRERARALAGQLGVVAGECQELPERDPAVLANPRGYALAERYTLLTAGAACLGLWRYGVRQSGCGFLSEPAWLAAALGRICLRLGLPGSEALREDTDAMVAHVVTRYHQGRSLDLYGTALGGAAGDGPPASAAAAVPPTWQAVGRS
ncbi:acyl-CoA dehydrogenase [Streptomyces sp. WMMC897]|uniref:acyl-CoA dehydrogenase n=1 Tax=Streptomyces sp. WMMC897 TaxID=3014782 RepID=UPI0022B7404B|nr:acyl-CoA dehydrogenase [Streptomyces sp. WMMC897]MCZ7414661.1 acyl-CoA dehydrogenase [Streptomyces sp. WMMC897]